MYAPYLLSGYVATLFLMLIGFRLVRRSAPDLRGQRNLYRFLLCATTGLVLLAARAWMPLFFTVILSNFLFFVSWLFLYVAATQIVGAPPKSLPWQVNLCAAALPPFFWFTYVHPSLTGRLFTHNVVLGAVAASTAILLFRHNEPGFRSPLRTAGWLLASVAFLQVACLAAAVRHPVSGDFMHPDLLEAAFSYLSLLLGLGNVAALMWLSLCYHRGDLHRMAQTDALTGLLNRGAFEEILRREIPRADRPDRPLGMLLIDIDYFKRVNDSLGHQAGDEVLRRIAGALRQTTRVCDVLARYGGEEFVVLLRGAGLEESAATAERIRFAISDLSGLPGEISLTASIGVAVAQATETAAAFLLRCDEALYAAKRSGRNLVSVSANPVGESAVSV